LRRSTSAVGQSTAGRISHNCIALRCNIYIYIIYNV
jgi:hypothetical protein